MKHILYKRRKIIAVSAVAALLFIVFFFLYLNTGYVGCTDISIDILIEILRDLSMNLSIEISAEIFIYAPCCLGYLWASGRFCTKYLGTSQRKELLFVIFSFIGWVLMNLVNRNYPVPYIFLMMLDHIFFMGLVLLLFRADWEKKILAASILITVRILTGNFCVSFLSCLTLFFWHTVKKIPEPVFNELESSAADAASLFMGILAVCWLSKRLGCVFYCMRGKWHVTLAVPLLLIILMFDVAGQGACNGIMVRSGGGMGLYYDQIFSHMEFFVLSALSMSAAGFYVSGMSRIYLEQKKSSQYQAQTAVYKMLTEQYSRTERLRHDMKNHIIALSGLLQGREWEKMEDYLKNMQDAGLEGGGDVTGNQAVDALLYQKRKWAQREQVRWECDVQIPKACRINEFDLCILFGNLLDNALEACQRLQRDGTYGGGRRFVNIQAKIIKKCFFLEVKNSMQEQEKIENQEKMKNYGKMKNQENRFTDKQNPQEHGMGLLNVSDVVRKYDGAVNIEAESGVFVISILIPLNPAAESFRT